MSLINEADLFCVVPVLTCLSVGSAGLESVPLFAPNWGKFISREGDRELWAQLESGFVFLALQPTQHVQLLPDLARRMRISYFNSVHFDWEIFIMDSENRFGQLSEPAFALVGFSVPKKDLFSYLSTCMGK